MNLPAPTADDYRDELRELVRALLDGGEEPRSIRRWMNQAIRGTKVAAEVAQAGARRAPRVADRIDYISDLQEGVRELRTRTPATGIRNLLTRLFGQHDHWGCPSCTPEAWLSTVDRGYVPDPNWKGRERAYKRPKIAAGAMEAVA